MIKEEKGVLDQQNYTDRNKQKERKRKQQDGFVPEDTQILSKS